MLGALDRKIQRRIIGDTLPDGVALRSHELHELESMVCATRKKNPHTAAGNTSVVALFGGMFGLGLLSNAIERVFGVEILPSTIAGMVVYMLVFWVAVPYTAYTVALRVGVRKRMRRFMRSPFCYHCEYEIPELLCTPDEASESASTLRCSECGMVIPRVVVERQATA